MHHSDRGSQYCSKAYRVLLDKYDIVSNKSRKGNCYDNVCIESFHSVIKKEWIFYKKYQTRAQAQVSILDYILHFYNCRRIHGAIGYKMLLPMKRNTTNRKKLVN
ncbi:integrase core domain-containing protein [Zhenhengia yiwuensis]|uniref:integrase core domain-containing protein n=1 Tax=Zhenhengia yiwuensis TaxID=2763666 RepID=UPI002A7616A8|nr:integrase core domain-containing protein [Zhenhengia yiwuensis]MDY3366888.1 integrase core domain-containing protein [Zhenhengia yiwuensis]